MHCRPAVPNLLFVLMLQGCGCNPDDTNGSTDVPPVPDDPTEAMDPGVRTLARLNQRQYNYAVRDLLGTQKTPADVFPRDEIDNGFDNQGSVLSTTSVHLELWEGAATTVLDEMFGRVPEQTVVQELDAEDPAMTLRGKVEVKNDVVILQDGSVEAQLLMDFDGSFQIDAYAYGTLATPGGASPELSLTVDGIVRGTVVIDTLGAPGENVTPTLFTFTTDLDQGLHTFNLGIANPFTDRDTGQDRVVALDKFAVAGPTDPQVGPSPAYDAFVACGASGFPDRACAEEAVATFGHRAWRRTLTDDDVSWVLAFYDAAVSAGEDESWALEYAFKAIMMAPEFLYHVEQDPPEGETARALDGFEVANRLAAFLWSSVPDEELLTAAADGSLLADGGVDAAVTRMLADDRSLALVDSLATQWFDIDILETFVPDPYLYPEFNDDLSLSMQTELRLIADGFFRGDDDLRTVLLRNESWLDNNLANFYLAEGFPGEEDGSFMLYPTGRTGLLGTAGWLASHSRADAPSAVRRGKWVLESLLCSAPPPPPPNVEMFIVDIDGGSIREQEEALRSPDFCQSCHATMDPIGFATYGYDAIGASRTVDELGEPIDVSVEIGGVTLNGPAEVANWIADDPRLTDCVVEIAMTYATGRGMRLQDDAAIELAAQEFADGGFRFAALAKAVATSEPFLNRGTPPPPPPEE